MVPRRRLRALLAINDPYSPQVGLPADWAEPNDSQTAARDLLQVTGLQIWSGLSVHAANNDDWFEFQTRGPGVDGQYVRIDFVNARGNLDLQLYDSDGNLIPGLTSAGSADREEVSLAGLPEGTYYIRVYSSTRRTNPAYTLTINAPQPATGDWAEQHGAFTDDNTQAHAFDLRTIDSAAVFGALSIHPAGDVHWYHVVLPTAGLPGQYVRVDYEAGSGDLNLVLAGADGGPSGPPPPARTPARSRSTASTPATTTSSSAPTRPSTTPTTPSRSLSPTPTPAATGPSPPAASPTTTRWPTPSRSAAWRTSPRPALHARASST